MKVDRNFGKSPFLHNCLCVHDDRGGKKNALLQNRKIKIVSSYKDIS